MKWSKNDVFSFSESAENKFDKNLEKKFEKISKHIFGATAPRNIFDFRPLHGRKIGVTAPRKSFGQFRKTIYLLLFFRTILQDFFFRRKGSNIFAIPSTL